MNESDMYLRQSAKKRGTIGTKETYVAFVLDESGSMGSCVDVAISGFNEQLNVIQEEGHHGGRNFVSLYKFGCRPDSRPRRVFKNKSPSDLVPLSRDNYSPFGCTPMRDGIGMAISDLEQYDKDDGVNRAFLVVTFTDGLENASSEWSVEQLKEKQNALQDKGNWTFVVLGSTVDPTQFGENEGIFLGNLGSYDTPEESMAVASASLAMYYTTSRSGGETSSPTYLVNTGHTTEK